MTSPERRFLRSIVRQRNSALRDMPRYGNLRTVVYDYEQWDRMVLIYRARDEQVVDMPLTKFFRERLGPPEQHWVGGSERRRYQIWFYYPLYVMVHNVHGIIVERLTCASKDEAFAALTQLLRDLEIATCNSSGAQ